MIVNGKQIDTSKLLGHASTYMSQAATAKFWNVDRINFALSPYLTDEESWRIVDELEKMAESKYEGNFSPDDAMNWMAHMVGPERWQAVTMMWIMDNQNAILKLHHPEELREAWVHRITMTEGTDDEVRNSPKDYILIRTTRDPKLNEI